LDKQKETEQKIMQPLLLI